MWVTTWWTCPSCAGSAWRSPSPTPIPWSSRHAHWWTRAPGGRGAAREVCELIMEAQGTLEPMMARYL